jgi:hypothetical protein
MSSSICRTPRTREGERHGPVVTATGITGLPDLAPNADTALLQAARNGRRRRRCSPSSCCSVGSSR